MLLIMFLVSAGLACGQEYKVAVQNSKEGKLILKNFPGNLPVEGYSGNEVIITSDGGDFTPPERAKGLKPVFPGGNDNSGIGAYVEKNGNTVTATCILPITRRADYKIKVPDNFSLDIESGCERGSNISVTNVKGEIDIKNCQGIDLKNVTGPLVLSTISGNIDIAYGSTPPEKPISINAISGDIDITLPASTAADLDLKTIGGSFYSDFDFSQPKDNMKRIGGSKITYSMNGGGPEISIATVSSNVYIRKGK